MNICKTCNKETQNSKFCSKSCSAKYNNAGINRHGTVKQKCILCGKNCSTRNKKYCSYVCMKSHIKIQNVEHVLEGKRSSRKISKRYMLETYDSCFECGTNRIWNNKPLTLQCDHIDGDSSNNDISNLRLLCPNCHTQTVTYGSKNKNNPHGKEHRNKRLRYNRL